MTGIAAADVVDLASELISHPSVNPPGEEAAAVAFLRERLASSPVPFEIVTQEVEEGRENLIARAGDGERGTVVLSGHVDVVPATVADWTRDPFDPYVSDGRLVGRGAADMKGAIAAMVIAAEAYWESTSDPGAVVLAFVVGEEVGGIGTRHLVGEGIDADAAILGEPSGLRVAIAQKGVVRFDVTVHGEPSHSGRPDEGRNAIWGMRRVLERLEDVDRRLRSETNHPLLRPETLTVTLLEGGVAENVVPDSATCHVDWRLHPGRTDPGQYDERLDSALADLTLDGSPLEVTVDRNRYLRPAEIPREDPLVSGMLAAAEAAEIDSGVSGFDAVTDARYFVHDAGIPTVVCGPGSLQDDAHTVDESVSVSELAQAATLYRAALERLLG